MMTSVTVIVLLCGLGTFLLRFFPIWKAQRNQQSHQASGRVQRFLRGIGPAAITALLVVSLLPIFTATGPSANKFAPVAGLVSIYLTKRWLGGIAGPTLAGAVVYGALSHWLLV